MRKTKGEESKENDEATSSSANLHAKAEIFVEKGRRVWQRAAREHDDASYLNAFVTQDDNDDGAKKEVVVLQEQKEESLSEEMPPEYERLYKQYLAYYQTKYGVNNPDAEEEAEAKARKDSKVAVGSSEDAKPAPKKSNALGLIAAGYTDSDSE